MGLYQGSVSLASGGGISIQKVNTEINSHNTNTDSHGDIREELASVTSAVLYTEQSLTEDQKTQVRENIGIQGSIHVSASAPTDTSMLWVDTGNSGLLKYYDTTTSAWKICAAAYS